MSLSLCRDFQYSDLAGCCRRGVLIEHVGVQEVLVKVCAALHEEYITCTGKVRNHKAIAASFPLTAATVTVCIQRCPFAVVSMLYTSLLMLLGCWSRWSLHNFVCLHREIHIGRQCCLAQRTHTSSAMTAASVEGPRLEHLRLQLLSQSTCLSV